MVVSVSCRSTQKKNLYAFRFMSSCGRDHMRTACFFYIYIYVYNITHDIKYFNIILLHSFHLTCPAAASCIKDFLLYTTSYVISILRGRSSLVLIIPNTPRSFHHSQTTAEAPLTRLHPQRRETTPLWGITTLTEPGKDLTISTFISRLIHLGG